MFRHAFFSSSFEEAGCGGIGGDKGVSHAFVGVAGVGSVEGGDGTFGDTDGWDRFGGDGGFGGVALSCVVGLNGVHSAGVRCIKDWGGVPVEFVVVGFAEAVF